MSKVLKLKVEIEQLENKIWRIIEITDLKTVADLAYTILATFDSLAYHLYNIKHNNKNYDCMVCIEDNLDNEKFVDATITKLSQLDLTIDKKMAMKYDYGSTTTFVITYLESREIEKGNGRHYPFIIDGQGRGMIDDVYIDELVDIVNDTDRKGKSIHNYSPGYERFIKYDYRNYNIKSDNILLKGRVDEIKYGYEEYQN